METITLTFSKKPSYLVIRNIISEINLKEKFTNKQLLSRYGKLLLALNLYNYSDLIYCYKDYWLHTNMQYAAEVYKKELEHRGLFNKYTFFIERLNQN